jgi:hypothetical protein
MSKSPVPNMHAEEQFHAGTARHDLVCLSVKLNETVASEKGKSGVAYVMNSGSLRHPFYG